MQARAHNHSLTHSLTHINTNTLTNILHAHAIVYVEICLIEFACRFTYICVHLVV